MKKTLLCLSLMASAALSASAYDHFVAGTDEAPNYYLIRTERGNPFLSYSAEGVSNSNAEGAYVSHLTRLADATEVSLWKVTAGTEAGTVVIKNYSADVYLMNLNVTPADVTDEPTDIYLQQLDGNAFSIGVAASGASFLDANNWNNNCGNWYAADGGTTWYATMVDITNGDDINDLIQKAQLSSDVESAKANGVAQLERYAEVDVIAEVIAEGIAAINAVEITANYQAEVNQAVQDTWNKAFDILHTGLDGKSYAVKNLRRVASGVAPFFAVSAVDEKLVSCATMADLNAIFQFKSVGDNGYILYNEATKTYIGTAQTAVADEASAQTVYPMLAANGVYAGIAFPFEAGSTGDSWNMNTVASSTLTKWDVDAGSIWNLVEFDEETAIADATSGVISHLEAYAENVEPAADIFTTALADVKALKFSSTIASDAEAIETNAIADANTYLATALNGKKVQLRSLRGDYYIVPNTEATPFNQGEGVDPIEAYGYSISTTASDDADYDFTSAADGGYTVYSPVTERYFGPTIKNGQDNSMTQVDAAEAIVLTPQVAANGGNYGVGLTFVQDDATWAINTNTRGVHRWYLADPGSILAIKVVGNATQIAEINAVAPAAQGIYDLSGRRLSAPVKGINIINGRKVLVK